MGAKIKRDLEFCRQLINAKMVRCKYCGEIAKHFLHFNKDRIATFCCQPRAKQCKGYNKSKTIKPSWNTKYMECKIEKYEETQKQLIYRLNQIIIREKELDELQKYSDPICLDFFKIFKKNYQI